MDLQYKKFKDVNINDPFFDSLKQDYEGFEGWFEKKSNESAYVFENEKGSIDGFLYLKIEEGVVEDVNPPLSPLKRLKIGTFKINAHGTKLGERFLKKIFDHAIYLNVIEIYVTIFEKHSGLLALLKKYGFFEIATKETSSGTELVLIKKLNSDFKDILYSYPEINLKLASKYLLSLYPAWHTRLLPDSILKNEKSEIIKDVSHTNSIHKVYLAAMEGMENLKRGDILLIYRTSDGKGAARFRSVATSICVIEEYRHISSFDNKDEFLKYCAPYSIFTQSELNGFWNNKRYPFIIKFTYNVALTKRLTRGVMVDEIGLKEDAYWGFMPLTDEQLIKIAAAGGVDESLIIH